MPAFVVQLQVEVITGKLKFYEAGTEVILSVEGKGRVFEIDSETKFQEATGRDNQVLADGPWWSNGNLVAAQQPPAESSTSSCR